MLTSIIIVTYNNLKYTKLCINSIRKYTLVASYEIIVVDNNSIDGTRNWITQEKSIVAIFNNYNKGFLKACNQGIQIARGTSILLLNNDVIVTPNYLTNMLRCLYTHNDIGAVGAISNYVSNYQAIKTNFTSLNDMLGFATKNNCLNTIKYEERIKLVGFCMLIKKSAVEKVGLLDERFSPGNFEDDDYSFRLRQSGYKLIVCYNSFVYHFGSISFNNNKNKFKKLLEKNRIKFYDKWGFDAWNSCVIKFDLINKINTENNTLNILEIGCGCGATLLKIKEQYKNVSLYGIDTNSNALEICKSFANVKCLDIEKDELDYNCKFFDYILLEKNSNKNSNYINIITKLKKHLKDDGKIIS